MGFYNDQVLPRFIDLAMGKPMNPMRAKVTAGLSGEVLELGFGSGRNLPHVPPAVTRFLAVEPATVARQLAAGRIAQAPFPVELIGPDGQEIPIDDDSVDHVVVTWTLCTIPNVERALAETHRVLRPGGQLHFIEHGRSPRQEVARWQDRVTPTWKKIFGGCHLNRQMDELIENAGLRLDQIDKYKMVGPEFFSFAYEGIATKPQA
jgi:ubiquinone/menaquinone biosynthesis C-methylase UbiE